MDRADGKHFLEAEPGEFVHVFFREARVHLVDRDQNGFTAGPQFLRDLAIERRHTFLNVDHENDGARGVDGDFHLLERGLGDDVLGFLTAQQADAAGVHERVDAPLPFGLDAHTVARDARLIMDDGDAPLDNTVEQRGFPDVWAAYDGNKIRHSDTMR